MSRSGVVGYDANDSKVRLADSRADKGVSLSGGGTLERALVGHTAESLIGTIKRKDSEFTIEVDWERDDGTVIFTETIAAGLTGGTKRDFNVTAPSPYATVRVKDEGSGSGTVSYTIRMV